jgi:hypothetical protein
MGQRFLQREVLRCVTREPSLISLIFANLVTSGS